MKKVLMVLTAFSPENAIGSIRTTKIAKYLVQHGYEVTVIKPKKENIKIDPTLMTDEIKSIKQIEIDHSSFFRRVVKKQRNKVLQNSTASQLINKQSDKQSIKRRLIKFFFTLYTFMKAFDWVKQVKSFMRNHEEYDIVFSSYPSLESHLSAHMIKKRSKAKYWIADYRDTLVYEKIDNPISTKIKHYLEKKYRRDVDIVTVISNGLKQNMQNTFGDKLRVLSNGFDNDDVKLDSFTSELVDDYKIRISYVGSLYGGLRDISIVFEAIKDLIVSDSINADEIDLIYAGREYDIFLTQAKQYGIDNLCSNRGLISREESLKLQYSSDANIICTWNEKRNTGIVTGKVYESLLLRKNVITVINGERCDCDIKTIIDSSGLGISIYNQDYTQDEYTNMKEFIKSLGTNEKKIYNEAFIESYNYKQIISRFIEDVIKKEIV